MIRASGNIEIIYEYGALRFTKNNEENGFNKDKATDMSWYLRKENKFEILSEEDEEIDFQSIEHKELDILQEVLGKCDLWQGNEDYILKVINENNNRLVNAILKVSNENKTILKAIKQLDLKIKEKEND